MLEVLLRDSSRLQELAWRSRVAGPGGGKIALLRDPGGLLGPSRSADLLMPGGEQFVVVRLVSGERVRRQRPAIPFLVARVMRWESLSWSLLPIGLGLSLADTPHLWMVLEVLLATCAVHGGANLVGEAIQYVRGQDVAHRAGGSKILQEGFLSAHHVYRFGALLLLLGTVLGLHLASRVASPALLGLGAFGVVAGWQYSAPPLQAGRRPTGDLLLLFIFGPGLCLGASLSAGATLGPVPILVGLLGSLVTALPRQLRNLRRMPDDALIGQQTLTGMLGFERARQSLLWIATLWLIFPVVLVGTGILPSVSLLSGVTAPALVWALRPTRAAFAPHDPALGRAEKRLHWVCVLYATSLLLSVGAASGGML